MASKIRVLIEADGKVYESQLNRAKKSTREFGGATKNSAAQVSHFSTVLKGAAGVIAGLGLARLAREVVQANIELERINNTLRVATGSAEAGAQEMKFLREQAERLGFDLRSSAQAYAQFAAATRETALEGEDTRQIFLGVVEATTAMGLSAEQTQGALTAMEQIVSKGRVSAEELRQQLGERIPGAFRRAASSIGVTTAELDKMLETGQLTAEQLLPALARELRSAFKEDAERAANDLQQEINKLSNAFFEITSGGDIEGLTDAIGELTDTLKDPDIQEGLRDLIGGVATLTEWAVRAGAAIGDLVDQMRKEQADRLRKEINDTQSRIESLEESASRPFLMKLFGRDPQEEIRTLQAHITELRDEIDLIENPARRAGEAIQNLNRFGILQQSDEFSLRDPNRPLIFPQDEVRPALSGDDGPDEDRQKAIDAADKSIAKLEEELALIGKKTELEKLNAQIRLGAFEDAEKWQRDRLRFLAEEIDKEQARQELQKNFQDLQQDILEDTTAAAELERQRYEEDLARLRRAEEEKFDSIVSYRELRERLERRHHENLKEIAEEGAERELREMEEQLGDIAFAARDAFSEFEDAIIQAARTGELAMRDMVEAILADIARLAIQENVTNPLYRAILPVLTTAFGGGGQGYTSETTPEGFTNTVPTAGGHGGAVIGHEASSRHRVDPAVFDGARRYHRGGLLGDEVPFIGRRGEGVFTEEQMKRLAPVDAANDRAPRLTVIVNNNGEPAEVERTEQREGPGGEQIYELWLSEFGRDLNRNGRASQIMEGTYPSLRRGGARR